MPPFGLTCGEGVLLWLPDRALLATGMPAADLRQSLQSIGIVCEPRYSDDLGPWELALSHPTLSRVPPGTSEQLEEPDSFLLASNEAGLRLSSCSPRGFAYGIWEILEKMGWEWPTPQITREPKQRTWTFDKPVEHPHPALKHRILFAEEVTIAPDTVRWLSRLRFNTLFPSNPSHFSEPEDQIPEESLALAQDLGLDLIAGGDCLSWLSAPLGIEAPLNWADIDPNLLNQLGHAAIALWREMGQPRPRLSVWPTKGGEANTAKLLQSLLVREPDLCIETSPGVIGSSEFSGRVLIHQRVSEFTSGPGLDMRLLADLSEESPTSCYLFLDSERWNPLLGNLLTPLLWSAHAEWIEVVRRAGWGGACLPLVGVHSASYLERAGFFLASCARVMWQGDAETCTDFFERMVRSQFEAGAPIVLTILREAEECLNRVAFAPGDVGREGDPGQARLRVLEQVHDFLESEDLRDRLDQRIAELEESPPSEPCLEFARSLSTLVMLYDLEECRDFHEERALARMIWTQNDIDRWPSWLRETSPLVERLRNLLR